MYCEACGAALPVQQGRGRRRLVCNDACWQRVYRRRQRLAGAGIPTEPVCLHGRFEAYAEVYEAKIDVIITDPPYARKVLPIYAALGQFALTTLVPGGWLLCLTGWGIDLEIRQQWLALGLEFVTVGLYVMPSVHNQSEKWTSTGKRIWQEYAKPILWFQKRGTRVHRRRAGPRDRIAVVGAPDPTRRKDEQSLAAFQDLVAVYTNMQDVICDPCMGWGTTLEACVSQERRRVIGIEMLRERYEYAVKRLGLTSEAA
jgi:hypothetical protein